MLNTFGLSLMTWKTAIEREMNGAQEWTGGPRELNSSPPWKLCFNSWWFVSTSVIPFHQSLSCVSVDGYVKGKSDYLIDLLSWPSWHEWHICQW